MGSRRGPRAGLGGVNAERVLVQFEYLFETADATEIVVYLSDVPDLLDHDDPLRDQHYVEIGRVPAPAGGPSRRLREWTVRRL